MIDRYLLRYFLAVVDHGNFSKAADFCHVSQPTLSVGIAKLERMLGRTLFNRTNRRVELTEAGVHFATRARRIEAEFVSAEREIDELPEMPILKLGILTTLPTSPLEALLTTLREDRTPLHVDLLEGRVRELADSLSRGSIDVALTILPEDMRGAKADVLFSEGYSLALPAGHPFAARASVAAEELAGETMIARRHCEVLLETSRHFTKFGVRPRFAAKTTNDDRAIAYVRAGLGITVMPDCFRADGVARPRLSGFDATRAIGLLFARHVDADQLRQTPFIRALATAFEPFAQTGG